MAGNTMSAIAAVSVMNCSCTHTNRFLTRETFVHFDQFRGDHHRVGVLNDHRGNRRSVANILRFSGKHRTDPRLIEDPHRAINRVQSFNQRLVDVVDVGIRKKRPRLPDAARNPVTVGRQVTAWKFAAPFRERVKP